MKVKASINPPCRPAEVLPKILAVDDRPENLHSLKRILSDVQAQVIAVPSGQEALAQILRHDFALILLDVMMPEMDGFETAALIRDHRASQQIPIIFVTAADRDQSYEDKGYNLGAVDYLFKPIQPHILLSKVRVFMDQANQQQQLVQNLREIQRLQDSHAVLLHSVSEGILSLDVDGRITFANSAAPGLLGIEPGQLEGRYLTDFLLLAEDRPADSHWLSHSLYPHCRENRGGSYDQHWFRHARGHRFPIEYTVSPLNERPDQFTGVVLVFQDISERKEREVLELANKHKSTFLANISHELRSPLHSLLILAKRLAANTEGNLQADQIKAATVIQREGQDLLHLINDILDLSKVEAGKMAMHWDEAPIAAMLQHLESQFTPLAVEKGLACHWDLSAGVPDSLHTDRLRLQQVLKNLLANAIKFTTQGRVSLRISRVGRGETEAIAFAVSDTGIGIAAAKQVEIFDDFQQVDVAINRHYEGTGLGLAICRELTRLLGGHLSVQSALGQGSCFTLYLPLQPPADGAGLEQPDKLPLILPANRTRAPARQPQPVTPDQWLDIAPRLAELAPGRNLLLLDSDMRNSFTLAAWLRRHGFRVIKADSYASALATLEQEPQVDLLLLALMPPSPAAQQLVTLIRARQGQQSAAVILMRDPQQPDHADTGLQQCADACVLKPLATTQLLTPLTACLEAMPTPVAPVVREINK